MLKKIVFVGVFSVTCLKLYSQDSLKIAQVDSIVNVNENKISKVFQKIEKNSMETLDGKNPKKLSDIFRFSDSKVLVSYSGMAYSDGDTMIIINLYFDSGSLIKAKTISFDNYNKKTEYNYYYNKNELINKEMDSTGIHRGSHYIYLASRIRKSLKKQSIRFPPI